MPKSATAKKLLELICASSVGVCSDLGVECYEVQYMLWRNDLGYQDIVAVAVLQQRGLINLGTWASRDLSRELS